MDLKQECDANVCVENLKEWDLFVRTRLIVPNAEAIKPVKNEMETLVFNIRNDIKKLETEKCLSYEISKNLREFKYEDELNTIAKYLQSRGYFSEIYISFYYNVNQATQHDLYPDYDPVYSFAIALKSQDLPKDVERPKN